MKKLLIFMLLLICVLLVSCDGSDTTLYSTADSLKEDTASSAPKDETEDTASSAPKDETEDTASSIPKDVTEDEKEDVSVLQMYRAKPIPLFFGV